MHIFRFWLVLGLLALFAPMLTAPVQAHPAHARVVVQKDPCFFNHAEYFAWYNGPRWGQRLAGVEADANCTGVWDAMSGGWDGHDVKIRVWPRADGGQTQIVFANYAGLWKAHDISYTFNTNVGGDEFIRDCEWPRTPDAAPCKPAG